MSKIPQTYIINQEQRDSITEELGKLKKQNIQLQQSLREQQAKSTAESEDLFLELLEVADTLESLLTYLENNSNPTPEFIQRLPRSIGAIYRKLLNVLAKRQVVPIELEESQLDFNLYKVVDREVRTDLADQTITQILRRGFRRSEKILRPAEVIVSKNE